MFRSTTIRFSQRRWRSQAHYFTILLYWWLYRHKNWHWREAGYTYTTDDSLIVATPTNGHTSVVIARLDDELPCVASTTEAIDPILVVLIVLSVILVPTLTVIVNGYIFIVHLMFKELRTTFGKLLMLYCLLIICLSVSFDAKAILTSSQIGKQLVACHLSTISMMILLLALMCPLHVFFTALLTYCIAATSYSIFPRKSQSLGQDFILDASSVWWV